eukprot:TRINITY_DN9735_c0_g1_i3.p2 TRINITY_DN9735_c0_g1~~TRINITY_DN9735_c0_g1_i3.p2  ORF type:complete len:178 (-),score=38.45 TRINITY_DN9735_c0_g1_i3:166-699(-)
MPGIAAEMEVVGQAMPIHQQENTPQPILPVGQEVPAKRALGLSPEDSKLHDDKKVLLEADLEYVKQLSKSKEMYSDEQQQGSFQLGQAPEHPAGTRKSRPSSGKNVNRNITELKEDSPVDVQAKNQNLRETTLEDVHAPGIDEEAVEEECKVKKWTKIAVIGAIALLTLKIAKKLAI